MSVAENLMELLIDYWLWVSQVCPKDFCMIWQREGLCTSDDPILPYPHDGVRPVHIYMLPETDLQLCKHGKHLGIMYFLKRVSAENATSFMYRSLHRFKCQWKT
jgi:hypothetical protein